MKYLTIIFLLATATYNLQDENANYVVVKFMGNDVYFWRIFHNFFFDLALTGCFFTLGRKAIIKGERLIYYSGAVLASFYTAFRFVLLASPNMNAYLAKVNSDLWGGISAGIVIVILIGLLYDYQR